MYRNECVCYCMFMFSTSPHLMWRSYVLSITFIVPTLISPSSFPNSSMMFLNLQLAPSSWNKLVNQHQVRSQKRSLQKSPSPSPFPSDRPSRIVINKEDYFGMAADGLRNFDLWNVAHVVPLAGFFGGYEKVKCCLVWWLDMIIQVCLNISIFEIEDH